MKNLNKVDMLNNIKPIVVPLKAGDIYAHALFTSLEFINDDISNANTSISDDIIKTIESINDFVETMHSDFYQEVVNIIELRVRRRFNKIGVDGIRFRDPGIDNILVTKTLKVDVIVGDEYFTVDIKCAE